MASTHVKIKANTFDLDTWALCSLSPAYKSKFNAYHLPLFSLFQSKRSSLFLKRSRSFPTQVFAHVISFVGNAHSSLPSFQRCQHAVLFCLGVFALAVFFSWDTVLLTGSLCLVSDCHFLTEVFSDHLVSSRVPIPLALECHSIHCHCRIYHYTCNLFISYSIPHPHTMKWNQALLKGRATSILLIIGSQMPNMVAAMERGLNKYFLNNERKGWI